MKQEEAVQFKSTQTTEAPLTMMMAISAAKSAVATMTHLQIDSVVRCTQADNGGWTIVVDVIESLARMGDNDLLATYQLDLGGNAELQSYNRLRRYHREDRDA